MRSHNQIQQNNGKIYGNSYDTGYNKTISSILCKYAAISLNTSPKITKKQ